MSFEILKNNPALIRDGKRLNELIEKYEQQKLELIKLGELISEQTSFKSQYISRDGILSWSCSIFTFNRFFSDKSNNILKYKMETHNPKLFIEIWSEYFNRFLLTEHQFLKLFEIEE